MLVNRVDVAAKRAWRNLKWGIDAADSGVIPAWIAEHDLGPPQAVRDALRRLGDTGYSRRSDDIAEAFALWATRRHGWHPEPALLQNTSDVMQGIWACVSAFSEPGEGVVLSPPMYPPFHDICEGLRRRQILWPLRLTDQGWRHDLGELEALLKSHPHARILLLCNPHNPTGRVYEEANLRRLLELAHEHGLLIVSDEIHADIVYEGFRHRPLLSIPGAAPRAVALYSPGKTFAVSGLRVAVAAFADERLLAQFCERAPRPLLGDISRAGSEAAVVAWETGEAWLEKLLALFARHRERITEALGAFPEVGYHPPEATFLAWLDLSACGLGSRPAERLLSRALLRVFPGEDFGVGGAGFVRLNFGTSSALLEEILERLSGALEQAGAT